jgi:hypothetical protein
MVAWKVEQKVVLMDSHLADLKARMMVGKKADMTAP